MVKKARVALHGRQNRSVVVDLHATEGATIGENLRWPDGRVVQSVQLVQTTVVQTPGGGSSGVVTSPTLWGLILNRPVFIDALAALATKGLVVRTSDAGAAATRVLVEDVGRVEIADADAIAGNPTFTLGPFPTVKNKIESGEEATVPEKHQFIVADELILDGGELILEDEAEAIVLDSAQEKYPLVKDNIPAGEEFLIPAEHQLLVSGALDIQGIVDVQGSLVLL